MAYLNCGLPRWLARQRTGHYLLEFVGAFGLSIDLKVRVLQYFAPTALPPAYLHSPGFVLGTVGGSLFVVLFIAMLRFSVNWFALEAKTKALENAQLLSELQFRIVAALD